MEPEHVKHLKVGGYNGLAAPVEPERDCPAKLFLDLQINYKFKQIAN